VLGLAIGSGLASIAPAATRRGDAGLIKVRLRGGALAMDARLRSAPAKLPRWVSAVVLLMATAAIAIGLILAGFGLFAALRIAHDSGASLERASAAAPFASSAWQRHSAGGADRTIPGAIGPPVMAKSDAPESELSLETGSARSEPPNGNAARPGAIADSVPAAVPPPASSVPAPATAAEGEVTDSIHHTAAAAPTSESATAHPTQTKRHPAVKRHVVRKRIRRIARRPAYSGAAASPFQPMFSSP